jgi:sugar phosphate isomerase/epimerase
MTSAAATAALWTPSSRAAELEPVPPRKFTICLACGPIGVPDDPKKAIERAVRFGFESIEPSATFLAKLSDSELADYVGKMGEAKLVWGAGGLPVQFRGDDAAFARDLQALPLIAKTFQRAGVTRVATWLTPASANLTYVTNFRLHAKRFREIGKMLGDHGIRLGLEYVAPRTSWVDKRYPFIHSLAEMKDLVAEIGRDNVGFLLDSWHWYCARDTVEDLLSLRGDQVILCHLNDAPAGIAVEQQVDGRRALPCSTGVIDMRGFLRAMAKIGYDGPLVCEPFSAELRKPLPDEILATVAASMKQAVALAT